MPLDGRTIVMTAFKRADYTKTVLEHLAQCRGIEKYTLSIFVDPGYDEVIDLVFRQQLPCSKQVCLNPDRIGCNFNTYQALSYGFSVDDYVIMLEDDTVPSKDALEYFEWAREAYRNDAEIMTVCGYKRSSNELPLDSYHTASRFAWFTPWGWASWKDRWEFMQEAWDNFVAQSRASWDVCLTELIRKPRGLKEISPDLGRIQNIGGVGGEHCPGPEWHKENQYNEFWAGSVELKGGTFREI